MRLHFFGATGEVTGACYLLEVGKEKILLDCGLIQGSRRDEERNALPFSFDIKEIDAVVLSHAHIDHSGRLPLLYKRGYRGPIYSQSATVDLCEIMLKDAGFINEKDVNWLNRKRERKGQAPIEPLYDVNDAEAVMHQFARCDYDQYKPISSQITIRFREAGHILGSSIVEIWIKTGSRTVKLVYSGDLGVQGAPIMRDPAFIDEADWVLMECTYGNRLHRTHEQTIDELRSVFTESAREKGNIIIPAFAVGRTQDLLFLFSKYFDEWKLSQWHIFVDSPMAIEATQIYNKHFKLFDKESREMMNGLEPTQILPNLRLVKRADESMAINRIASGAIIIAGSGMCTGGRVRHHLKHHLWHKNCHVVIVGFQARGTTGRALVDGAEYVRIFGETIKVAAQIHTIGGLSAHADQAGLLEWYQHFKKRPPVILVHGEADTRRDFAGKLKQQFNCRVMEPEYGSVISLD